jgi:hypothetical protein
VKTKPKKRKGITYPSLLTPDTGIHTIQTPDGPRFKIWYHNDGKKRYLLLPPCDMAEARERRSHFYRNLATKYGAKRRTPRPAEVDPKPYTVSVLKPNQYVYLQPAVWVVRIGSKKVGSAKTPEKARAMRDAWLRENAAKVPHIQLV